MNADHPDSAWRATARESRRFPVLENDLVTDTLIVGGGFTGLSTARELMRRDIDCAVLEGQDIGWGASGRSGGFAVPRYKQNFSALADTYGEDVALDLFRQSVEAVDSIAETIETFGIDCDFQRNGHLTPAHSRTALAGLQADIAWLSKRAGDTTARLVGKNETADMLGTPIYHGAYLDPRGACLHPYNYVRGLATALQERGLPVFIATPVVSLTREAEHWIATTARCQVRARNVVLATNAYSSELTETDDLYRRIVPVASSVVATRPLSPEESARTLPCRLPVTDSKRIVSYFRMLPTGQLLFGGRGDITGRRSDPAVFRTLERQLAKTYPHLADIEIQQRWAGMVAVSLDSFPHIGHLDNRLFFALGYGGRGVALTSLMGRHLASLVAGESVSAGPMSEATFGTVPFHGWRRTGMRVMSRYYQVRDLFER